MVQVESAQVEVLLVEVVLVGLVQVDEMMQAEAVFGRWGWCCGCFDCSNQAFFFNFERTPSS